MDSLRSLFMLDPEVIFLNHGSFGACPKPVFDIYQNWQQELEHQPVEFLGRRATDLLAKSRISLADYLGAEADEIVYFPNPTTAINMVARNLDLGPGDEVLATDHEYGAMDRTWRFICQRRGAKYIRQAIPLPVSEPEVLVEQVWSGVTSQTRVIFISHITSPTALTFPVAAICQRARQQGLISIVDGAHAPGQLPINLTELGADIYTGACHKWLMAPKGAAFLYARREIQPWLMPLVVSWGYESEHPSGSQFIDYHEWQGTRDLSAFLTVPAAIEFQAKYDWHEVGEKCHDLAMETRRRINQLTGLPPICPDEMDLDRIGYRWYQQMFSTLLPDGVDAERLKKTLYDIDHIEVPVIHWNDHKLVRVSIQAYNPQQDCDSLYLAIADFLMHLPDNRK
jgi:isopenicillin-N epimerase